MIIGAKVRGYQEGNFSSTNFNDKQLATVLYVDNDDEIQYYNLEAIRKIIDFQFVKTKVFLKMLFLVYLLGFQLPYIISITTENIILQNMSYQVCLVTQLLIFGFEMLQLKEQKLDYFCDFYNLIDSSQCIFFFILYVKKMTS